MRFSLVTLFVGEPSEVSAWYTRHLGLVVLEETDRWVRLGDDTGNACLAFHRGEPVQPPEHVQVHFEVDDVDAEYQRLVSEGVGADTPPADKPWGWRVVAVRDPAGHVVELVTPLTSER